MRAIASVADAAFPAGEPISALHVGGGGLTLPRYLAEVRPGTVGTALDGVCVVSAIMGAPDPRAAAADLLARWEHARG